MPTSRQSGRPRRATAARVNTATAAILTGLVGTTPAQGNAQTVPPDSPTTASAATQEQLITAGRTLLAGLDAAFNGRDRAAYLRAFQPENAVLMESLRARLDYALKLAPRFSRETELLRVKRVADRVVLSVRARFRTIGADNPDDGTTMDAHALLACRETQDGKATATRLVPVFSVLVDYPQLVNHALDGEYQCSICNWGMGGHSNWLTVPTHPTGANCVEAVTFYRLGADLTVHVQVLLDDKPMPAAKLLAKVLQPIRADLAERGTGPLEVAIEPWLPSPVARLERDGLTGARALLQLPGARPVDLRVLAADRLFYAMTVEGSPTAMQSHTQELQRFLDDFHFVDNEQSAAATATATAEIFGGGRLEPGNLFVHGPLKVQQRGPEGWRGKQRIGAHLFDVSWQCPADRGRLWIRGHRPPIGAEKWTEKLADQHLVRLLAQNQLEIESLPPWRAAESADGFALRTIALQADPTRKGWRGQPRILRLAFRHDVLVVMDGCHTEDAVATALRTSMDSLAPR